MVLLSGRAINLNTRAATCRNVSDIDVELSPCRFVSRIDVRIALLYIPRVKRTRILSLTLTKKERELSCLCCHDLGRHDRFRQWFIYLIALA